MFYANYSELVKSEMVMWMCAMMMVWVGGWVGGGSVSMTTLVIIAYVPKRKFLASLIFPRILRPRFASLG